MVTKLFPMHAILTMKTGILMGDFGTAQELMEWVVGHPVWTHEIPSHFKTMQEKLSGLFPLLPSDANKSNWKQILASAIADFGNELEVPQGSEERSQSPLESLAAMVGEDKVTAVVV